jgi:AraC-like DNA-binding protein
MSTRRRKYLNYTTPWGVDLARAAQAGWSSFLIHECGYQSALDDWNHQAVDSPFWRFYHNPKPGCHLLFDGRQIPLGPDSCVLIPADTVFDCCGPVAACHLWLHFTVSHPGRAIHPAPLIIPMDTVLQTLARAVIETHQLQPDDARNQRLLHEGTALLHAAFARARFPTSDRLPDRLLEIISLIQRAPHSNLSNPLLAARAGMSVEAFIRAFRQHAGETPAAYVSNTRVRLAEQLLALTDKSVEQIAMECGFPNRHYLSRVFSKRIGCGPAEFRARQHRRKGI